MTVIARLHTTLATLGLTEADAILEAHLERAAKDERAYAEVLCELLDREVEARRARYLRTRMRLAHLPFIKNLDQFDFGFQPSIDEHQIRELRTLRFVHDASNVIFLGPPGVGKSHLAIAIGIKACASHKRVLFRPVPELLDELVAATVDQTLSARLEALSRLDLLILDELGYLPMDTRRANLFFQIVSRCYEHGSIIITSNKPFEEWGAIFGDEVIAAAVLDRLLHHSHIIPINGPSYRTRDKQTAKREGR